jgi:UDPglucose 6-dehydrogenase
VKISIIGAGYVGLVSGTCLADAGNDVTCLDNDPGKVERLQNGDIPIYEPGLTELIKNNTRAGRLRFTHDPSEAVAGARCVFICVGTPQRDDGSADLTYVENCCRDIGPHLKDDAMVVVKSTVPVGTNRRVAAWLKESAGRDVATASNPEFLKEGAAIDDFTKPDRIVVGSDSEDVIDVLRELYRPFLRTEHPFLAMGTESAEMTKYVANCMLATKISFINEMANLSELVGADINEVRRGIGFDARIGFQFLFPGVGYGGSCFPKDVRALASLAESKGMQPQILRSVDRVNDAQKETLFRKIDRHFDSNLNGKTIGIWGLSFKPKTDDIREAPALVLIEQLLGAGASIRVNDPIAEANVRAIYGERLVYCPDRYEAADGADALAILTEWNEFRTPDFAYLKQKLTSAVVFDGRNLYNPKTMAKHGFTYFGVGLRSQPE